MSHKAKRIFDPLYGPTDLSEFEYSLVMSPEIQRLRYVRLCNINSLLITGASEISRFEHVLGVLRLAKEWARVNSNYSKPELEPFIAAALLHDFQTGPFGHSLQYVLEDNKSEEEFKHDDLEHGSHLSYHQSTDANATFCGRPFVSSSLLKHNWKLVTQMIKGHGEFGPLISGSMDLDNIDNVIRLAYHVGVADSSDSHVALDLARNLTSKGSILYCSTRSIPSIKRWFDIRKRLYELLLLDWAEFSAKAMLTRAIELAVDFRLLGPEVWLKTDLEFLQYLEEKGLGEGQEISTLIKRIKCGDLYSPILLSRSNNVELYSIFSEISSKREMEKQLKEKLRNENIRTSVAIHPILDIKKTMRSVAVTLRESEEEVRVGEDSKQLLIGVFSSNEIMSAAKAETANKIIKDFLIGKGLRDIEDIEDPIQLNKETQLHLL